MSKQPWRIKLEQWLAANGDEGMPGIVDHIAVLNRVTSLIRRPGFKKALVKFLDEWEGLPEQKEDPILRLLSEDETITIAPCDGSRCIGTQDAVFGFIDPTYKGSDFNKRGQPTEAMKVDVHEMVKDATFAKMFGSLGAPDLNKLCLSQDQVVEFCKNHSKWLRSDGYATFFLFKENENFFVARVRVSSGGLRVGVDGLEDDGVWGAVCARRVVAPQLTV